MSIGGISALGAAAQGQWETNLGPWQLMLAKATKRTERAEAFAQQVVRYIRECNSPYRLHVAWLLTRHCISQALVYDARLIDPAGYYGNIAQYGPATIIRLVAPNSARAYGRLQFTQFQLNVGASVRCNMVNFTVQVGCPHTNISKAGIL